MTAFATIEELAKRERVDRGYMSRDLRLTLLTPDVVEAILDGGKPEEVRLEDLLDGFPVEWEAQRTLGAALVATGARPGRRSPI